MTAPVIAVYHKNMFARNGIAIKLFSIDEYYI